MDYLRIPETSLGAERLSDTQEKTTKRLAELKSYLEKKVEEHQNEIHDLQSFLETVDNILAEKSYRRVQLPKSIPETPAAIDSNPPHLGVNLALPNCTLNNPRAVPDEEKDDSAAGSFVLEPSTDQNLSPVQATCENILDPDSFVQPNTPDERAEGREWII